MTGPVQDLGTRIVDAVFAGLSVDDEWSVRHERGFEWWTHRSSQRVWSDEPERHPSGETTWLIHAEAVCAEVPPDFDESVRQLDAVLSAFGQRLSMTAIVRTEDRVSLHATVVGHEGNVDWLERVFQVVVLSQARVAMKAAPILSAVFGLEPPESEHPSSGERTEPDEVLGALDNPPHAEDWSYAEFGRAGDYLADAGILATADVAGLTAEFPIAPGGPPAILGGATVLLTAEAEDRDDGCQLRLTLRLPSWPRDVDEVQILPVEFNAMEASGESGAHLVGSWAADDEDPAAPPFFTSILPPVLYQPGLLTNLVLAMAVRARWVSDFVELPAVIGAGPLPDLNDEGFRAGFVEFLEEYLTHNEEEPADADGQWSDDDREEEVDRAAQRADLLDGAATTGRLNELVQSVAARIRDLGPDEVRSVEVAVSSKDLRVKVARNANGQPVAVGWGTRHLLPEIDELATELGAPFVLELRDDGTCGLYEDRDA